MGSGRGKGGDQSGAIAAGCCGIYCMVCFFLVGLPMLIGGIVCVRIAAGDYDDRIEDEYYDCIRDNNGCSIWDSCSTEECTSPEEWEDAKDTIRTVGIVLIVLSLISLVAGLVLILLMFTSLCKRGSPQPMVHTAGGATVVTSYPMQQPGAYPQQPGVYPQQPGVYPQQQGFPAQGAYPQAPYPTGDMQKPPAYSPAYTAPDAPGEKNPAFGQ